MWQTLNAGPIDQPKDVYYMMLLPDSPELIPSARFYLRHLSDTYESMRLGRHLPWPRTALGQQAKTPDGLLIGMPPPGEEYDGCVRIGSGRFVSFNRRVFPELLCKEQWEPILTLPLSSSKESRNMSRTRLCSLNFRFEVEKGEKMREFSPMRHASRSNCLPC